MKLWKAKSPKVGTNDHLNFNTFGSLVAIHSLIFKVLSKQEILLFIFFWNFILITLRIIIIAVDCRNCKWWMQRPHENKHLAIIELNNSTFRGFIVLYTNMADDALFCTQMWPPWRHVKTIYTIAKSKIKVTQKLFEVRNSFFVSSYSRQLSLNVKAFLVSLTRLLTWPDHSVHHQIPFVADTNLRRLFHKVHSEEFLRKVGLS